MMSSETFHPVAARVNDPYVVPERVAGATWHDCGTPLMTALHEVDVMEMQMAFHVALQGSIFDKSVEDPKVMVWPPNTIELEVDPKAVPANTSVQMEKVACKG